MTFLPSKNGFLFGNDLGLCGGMTYAARWLFRKHLVCKAANLPSSRLFWRLLGWQLRSILPFGWLKIYLHQCGLLPDEGMARMRSGLRHGPVPIVIVWKHSWNPIRLPDSHQVLAYDLTGDILSIYDPNWPGDDSVRITGHTHSHDGQMYRFYRSG